MIEKYFLNKWNKDKELVMSFKLIKLGILVVSVVGVTALILATQKEPNIQGSIKKGSMKTNTQTVTVAQGLKAYVDPVTGEFVSSPVAENTTTNNSTVETSIQPQNNNFSATVNDDGSVSIDTSNMMAPLMATTDKNGKVHIEHGTNKVIKGVK